MKKALRVLLIAVLGATLIFGSMSTALAAAEPEMGAQALAQLQVTSLPSGPDLWMQPFNVHNPNNVAVTFQYGKWGTPEDQLQTGSVAAGGDAVIYMEDVGLKGSTMMVIADGNIMTFGDSREYIVWVKHLAEDGREIIPAEEHILQPDKVPQLKFTPRTDLVSANGYKYVALNNTTEIRKFYPGNVSAFESTGVSLAQRTVTFTYREDTPQAYDVAAVCIFADGNTVVGTKAFTVQPGGSRNDIMPDASITFGGREYTLQTGQAARTHSYGDGQKEYNFYYDIVPLAPTSPYNISVRYVIGGANGQIVAINNVVIPVGETVTVDIPTHYSAGNGLEYDRVDNTSQIVHAANNPTRVYNIEFKQVALATDPYDIKIVYANALTGQEIQSVTVHVGLNESVTKEVPSTLDVNSTQYLIASGQPKTIMHQFKDVARTYTVYYNEKGAAEVNPYDITIRALRNTDNAVLKTITKTIPIGETAKITVPDTEIVIDRIVYVPTTVGWTQETHNFGDQKRVYDVFYRQVREAEEDEPDTENPIQVIVGDPEYVEQVVNGAPNVITTPGGTTYIDGGTTYTGGTGGTGTTGTGGTGTTGTGGTGADATGTGTDATAEGTGTDTPTVPEDTITDGETPAVAGDGSTVNDGTESNIDDGATPLSGFRNEDGSLKWGWIVLDIALLGVVAILVVLLVKRANEKKEQNQAAH